jgi:Sec-independent protein translocase protein TatA
LWYCCAVFGLDFGELFIVAFVVITVLGAPYAGPLAERVAVLLHLVRAEVDASSQSEPSEADRDVTEEPRG